MKYIDEFRDGDVAQGIARASLVTHAGVIKVLVGLERQLPPRNWMALSFGYECVICVTLTRTSALPAARQQVMDFRHCRG